MTTARITLPLLRRGVSIVLRKWGTEHVYDKSNSYSCNYTNPDRLGCLIGEVFRELGIPVPSNTLGLFRKAVSNGRYRDNTGQKVDLIITPKAAAYIEEAQSAQDNGLTWGAAKASGERAAHNTYRY